MRVVNVWIVSYIDWFSSHEGCMDQWQRVRFAYGTTRDQSPEDTSFDRQIRSNAFFDLLDSQRRIIGVIRYCVVAHKISKRELQNDGLFNIITIRRSICTNLDALSGYHPVSKIVQVWILFLQACLHFLKDIFHVDFSFLKCADFFNFLFLSTTLSFNFCRKRCPSIYSSSSLSRFRLQSPLSKPRLPPFLFRYLTPSTRCSTFKAFICHFWWRFSSVFLFFCPQH